MKPVCRVCLPAVPLAAVGLCLAAIVTASPLTNTRTTLPNGLRVVLAPDSNATAVSAGLWFPAGSRFEKPTQSGLAMLAARLAFRSGDALPLAPLTAVGGEGSIVVTPDYASFVTQVPPDALDQALEFLALRTTPRTTRPQDLAAERAALKLDGERADRPPVARAVSQLWAAAWPGHAYAQTGVTPTQSAATITPADLDAWRRSRLGVGNATLTIVGAFDAERALAAVRARFGNQARTAAAAAGATSAPRAPQRARSRMDLPVRLCLVGWRAPGAGDADAPALELLAAWLGGQPKARLGRVLMDDWKLAVATQAGFVAQREGSLLWTMAAVAPEADSGAVETTLLDAVSGVTRVAPDAAEFEHARRQLESSVLFALQTARQRTQALGEAEMLAGDVAAAERRLQALARVTPADVQRVAARVLTDANRATLWVAPASTGGAR